MKSKFAITLIALLALSLGVSQLSHAAKNVHVSKHDVISLSVESGAASQAFVLSPAILAVEVYITEYRPLVGIIVVKTKTVSNVTVDLAHRARDNI